MQVEGYRDSKQGFGVAPRGIRCRAASVPWVEARIPNNSSVGFAATVKKATETAAFLIFRRSAL